MDCWRLRESPTKIVPPILPRNAVVVANILQTAHRFYCKKKIFCITLIQNEAPCTWFLLESMLQRRTVICICLTLFKNLTKNFYFILFLLKIKEINFQGIFLGAMKKISNAQLNAVYLAHVHVKFYKQFHFS